MYRAKYASTGRPALTISQRQMSDTKSRVLRQMVEYFTKAYAFIVHQVRQYTCISTVVKYDAQHFKNELYTRLG